MPKPQRAERFSFDGPAGRLEGLVDSPSARPVGVVVVCHPHPLHGGTLHNKVAHMLAKAFVGLDFAALRFNFRGVGDSEGDFADGDGESEDVRAALAVARERFPGLPVWLAGFSFGAAMAVKVAADTEVNGLIAVAPAAFRFAGNLDRQPRCPWLIVHGQDDELIPIEESIEWVNALEPGPELVVFPETSHFFHGRLVELRDTVAEFVGRHLEA